MKYIDKALNYFRRHPMGPYLTRTLELRATALERQGGEGQAHQAGLE